MRDAMSNFFRATLFIALAGTLPPLGAQNSGEITGAVTDSTGAAIAGATVTVKALATGQTRRVVTNETGAYSAPFLVPGLYDVSAERSGFKVATRKSVSERAECGQ
jgi:hypothetical protein